MTTLVATVTCSPRNGMRAIASTRSKVKFGSLKKLRTRTTARRAMSAARSHSRPAPRYSRRKSRHPAHNQEVGDLHPPHGFAPLLRGSGVQHLISTIAPMASPSAAMANARLPRACRSYPHTSACTSPSTRAAPAATDQMIVTRLIGGAPLEHTRGARASQLERIQRLRRWQSFLAEPRSYGVTQCALRSTHPSRAPAPAARSRRTA